jgi:hypothetical protein
MKRTILGAMLALVTMASSASAESWIFNRSYYSHSPTTGVRIGRQVASGPLFTRPQGEYISTGWRNMRSTIQVGGQVFDQTNIWESWVQGGQKF